MLQNSVNTIALGFSPQSHYHRVNLQFCELDSRSFDIFVMILNPNLIILSFGTKETSCNFPYLSKDCRKRDNLHNNAHYPRNCRKNLHTKNMRSMEIADKSPQQDRRKILLWVPAIFLLLPCASSSLCPCPCPFPPPFPPFPSAAEAALACLERRWHANTKIAHKPNTTFYNHNTESHFPPLVLNHPLLNHACNSFACKQTESCWREESNGVSPRFRVFGTEFIETTTTTTTTNPSIQIGHAFRPPQEIFFVPNKQNLIP